MTNAPSTEDPGQLQRQLQTVPPIPESFATLDGEEHSAISRPVQPETLSAPQLPTDAVTAPTSTDILQGVTLKAIYFFAGPQRKGDIKSWLEDSCKTIPCNLQLVEIDLLRGGLTHDLSVTTSQELWLRNIGSYHMVIITPPCSNYSRAVWANRFGPRPLRSARFPRGFPWLSSKDKEKADLNTGLVDFTWAVLRRVDELQNSQCIVAFAEHPEDLGRVRNQGPEAVPASIWRDPERLRLKDKGWWSGAFRQCDLGAPTPKPTRGLSNDNAFESLAVSSEPTFSTAGFYSGPVGVCNHDHSETLIRTDSNQSGPFRTQQAASYPSDMCRIIACSLITAVRKRWLTVAPPVGELSPATVQPAEFAFPPLPPPATVALSQELKGLLSDKILGLKLETMELRDPPASSTASSSTTPVTELRGGIESTVAPKWNL